VGGTLRDARRIVDLARTHAGSHLILRGYVVPKEYHAGGHGVFVGVYLPKYCHLSHGGIFGLGDSTSLAHSSPLQHSLDCGHRTSVCTTHFRQGRCGYDAWNLQGNNDATIFLRSSDVWRFLWNANGVGTNQKLGNESAAIALCKIRPFGGIVTLTWDHTAAADTAKIADHPPTPILIY
jgi:hypothetical protein